MLKNAIWAYPWDIVDEGMDQVIEKLKQHEINGINVTTIYHSGKFFLPHNPNKKLYFPQPGALYFEPDSSWYGNIKIKPPISPLASRRFWSDLREKTAKNGLSLSAWTLFLHNSQIGFAYPETCVVNAFGDAIPTDLCAANDDVREFLQALSQDLARNYQFDNILIESLEYMPFRHGYHHEVIGVPLTPTVEFFMSLSFSEGMLKKAQEANIDIQRVRSFVKHICSKQFSDPYHQNIHLTWEEIHSACEGEMHKFLALRQKLLTSLLAEVSAIIRKESKTKISIVDFGPLYPMGPDGMSWENGVNLQQQAALVDEIHPTFYFTDLHVLQKKVNEYFQLINQLDQKPAIVPAIRSILPQVSNKETLLSQVNILKPYSDAFTFYNYGFMPHQTLRWIQESLR